MKGILKKKGAYGGGIQSGGSRGKVKSFHAIVPSQSFARCVQEFKAKSLIGKTIEVKNRRFKVKEVLGEGSGLLLFSLALAQAKDERRPPEASCAHAAMTRRRVLFLGLLQAATPMCTEW